MPAPSWFHRVVSRRRTVPPHAADSALAVLVAFAAILQWIFPQENGDALTWLGFVLALGTSVPLVWRRRAPFAAGLAVSAATVAMALHHSPAPDVAYGGLVVLYTMAVMAPPRQRRFMLTCWLIGSTLTILAKGSSAQPFEYAFQLLTYVIAYGIGMLSRVQRAYSRELEDRAQRLERERKADTERAAAQERARIARDMHDILAHAVSLMVVQAEAGPVVVRSDPARAEAAFDAIAASGRDAMTQVRRILGVLKEERLEGTSAAPVRLPQPGTGDLPELVRQVSRSAGLRVELRGDGGPLSAVPGHLAGRLPRGPGGADEHGQARVRLLGYCRTRLAGGRVERDGDRRRAGAIGDGRGGGHGLIGLRERAAACGGTASAVPGPDGGFRVVVRLPVAADRFPAGHCRGPVGGLGRARG